MKSMIWKPEESDRKVNEYLDRSNHAPYELIFALLIGFFCASMLMFLVGIF